MARILLVDESSAERALVRMTLLLAGHRIVEAGTGEAALGLLRQAAVDVALIDLSLPDIDGRALIDAIRELPGHARLPIVTMREAAFRPWEASATLERMPIEHLVKPFSASLIKEMIDRATSSQHILDLERQSSEYADVIALQQEARVRTKG